MLIRLPHQLVSLLVWIGIHLCFALPTYAQKTLVITSLEKPIDIRPYLEIIPDPDWQYDSEAILSGELDHLWQTAPVESELLEASFIYHRLWFRIRVNNLSNSQTLTWYEPFPNKAFYYYALAHKTGDGPWLFSRNWSGFESYKPNTPEYFPSWRLNPIPWLSYNLDIKMNKQETIIIGQASESPGAPIHPLWQWLSPNETQSVMMQRFLFSIIIITAATTLSFYYLVVFLRLRLIPCLWISGLGLTFTISLLAFDKSLWILDSWISPINVWRIASTGMFFSSLIYIGFIASTLGIFERSNLFRKCFRFWILLTMFNWVYFIHSLSSLSHALVQASSYLSLFIAWGLLIKSVLQRVEGARLLSLGSLMFLCGYCISVPAFYGLYEASMITEWAIHIGAVAELFCFSLVLSGYTHKALQEKNVIQEELQAKNQFFASMAHELRTPLTAILGYSDSSLIQGLSKTELEANSKIIERSGKHLLELVNNNLDISKIEAGKLEIHSVEADMATLIHEIQQCFNVLVATKGLTFNVFIQGQIPNKATLDAMRVKQILMNLCSNAIKFTERGSVSIHIAWLEKTQQYQFIVEDTGIGLSKEQCNRLFSAYMQADKSTASHYGGTGLGLNLSKKLAELMYGDIRVESEPNKGSRFIVCIKPESIDDISFIDDQRFLAEREYFSEESSPLFKGKVLIVANDKNIRNILRHLIELAALKVDCAENGKLAMSAFFSNDDYDLIITDINLLKLDGIELAQRIRNENSDLPIVAISSQQEKSNLGSQNQFVFKAFLDKPIRKDQLFVLLAQYLPSTNPKPEILKGGPLRVLLAEDNLDNQKLIQVFLKKAGVDEVVVAENGSQAMNLARASDFDLILMDIQMPEMDGHEATRLLRKMDYHRRIYALTADDSEACVNDAKAAGCNGHLNKPIEFEKMLHLIQGIKEEKRTVGLTASCQTKLRKIH